MHNKELESVLSSHADRPHPDTTARSTDGLERVIVAVSYACMSFPSDNPSFRVER
ncbi:hypothetical protein AWB83_01940 [Caballeronia ptereochthonis]|uniref:Uncharacterized protein n=1 Tax=Caballeronia ptereochthonis TaxID=1777144 RepID=A0A158AK50_9BURK|nr:hypothetical protein AWB83_01940 [Caballeronia ptereochthonis]